jgi:hypothetical protein
VAGSAGLKQKEVIMHLITVYLAVVGTFTATTQAMRGVVRGVGKLIARKPREALGEVVGGLAAPLKTAYTQVCHLGEDVCRTARALTLEEEDGPDAVPEPAVQRRPAIVHPIVDTVSA